MNDLQRRMMLSERSVIVGYTSAAARLVGICLRDGEPELVDQGAAYLEQVVNGIELFGQLAGCDTGSEYTVIALRQIVGWMRARDYDSIAKALHERTNDGWDGGKFCESMVEAMKAQGVRV